MSEPVTPTEESEFWRAFDAHDFRKLPESSIQSYAESMLGFWIMGARSANLSPVGVLELLATIRALITALREEREKLKTVLDRETASQARNDARAEAAEAENARLREERNNQSYKSSRAISTHSQRRAKSEADAWALRLTLDNSPDARVFDILAGAMGEIKATCDGGGDQPIADIVSGCLAEIAALHPRARKALGGSHE